MGNLHMTNMVHEIILEELQKLYALSEYNKLSEMDKNIYEFM